VELVRKFAKPAPILDLPTDPSVINVPPRLAHLSAAARKGIYRLSQIPLPDRVNPRDPVVFNDVETTEEPGTGDIEEGLP